jgi:sortase A
MRPGDLIVLTMPYGRYTYRTEKQQIVSPNAYDYVTATRPYDRLALTACHPLYSAAKRIVVFARLLSVQSLGRARLPA